MNEELSGFAVRLREAVGGESVNSFARRCEIPEATMRNYFKRRIPDADVALQLADAANVNLVWLVSGRGPKEKLLEDGVFSGETVKSNGHIVGDFAYIQRLDVRASAGGGAITIHEDTVELLAFQNAWLKERHISPTKARVLTAKGDSMEPTIRDGDILLVDTSITSVRDNAIYIVVYGGHVLVKRVNLKRDGSLILISDNDRHPPEEVPLEEVPDLHIAGRVMWFGRSI